MSQELNRIQEFQIEQRLNILKGFKEVSSSSPIQISELRKALGDEPMYSIENIESYVKDSISTGGEEIKKAQSVLESLSSREVIDDNGYINKIYFYVEKGHMDHGGGAPAGSNGLVKKQIVDKTGKNTTKWVRPNKDEKKEDKIPANPDETKESQAKTPVEEHAKNTSTEDLKKYIAENPDGEHSNDAKAELQGRGEDGDSAEKQEVYQTPDTETLDSYYAMDETDQRAVLQASFDHNIPMKAALDMVNANKTDQTETHAAIDDAQSSLDSLKEKTGHPDVTGGEESNYSDEEMDMAENVFYDADFNHDTIEEQLKSGDDSGVKQIMDKLGLPEENLNGVVSAIKEQMDIDDSDNNENDSKSKEELESIFKQIEESLDKEDQDDVDYDEVDKLSSEVKKVIEKYDISEKQFMDIQMKGGFADLDLSYSEIMGDDSDNKEEAKSEIIKQDLHDLVSELDEISGNENFDMMDSKNPDSEYSEVMDNISDLIEEYGISEKTFDEISKNFKGLDLIYSDFVRS